MRDYDAGLMGVTVCRSPPAATTANPKPAYEQNPTEVPIGSGPTGREARTMEVVKRGTLAGTYPRRLVGYGATLGLASFVGSLFNHVYHNYVDAGPSEAFYLGTLSLGPAVLLVAAAELTDRALLSVHLLIAGGTLVMWWLFAASDSSTSALVFLYGWLVGIPVALAVAIASKPRL